MKLSHADVDYGPGHPMGDHCGICEHYIPGGPHCTEVVDPIEPLGWCVKYVERRDRRD